MARNVFALSIVLTGLVLGVVAEIASRQADEPVFEQGVLVGGALVVSGALAAVAYLLWPRSS